jgi:uroporphyrin-III C-methyltransferase
MTARSTVRSGKVYLIGAGPGDPELLTLKAARRLAEAEVILIDDLVDRRVLAHARATARIVEVGKRGGCRSTPQRFIERLMVSCARRGCVVARVKGGDPFIFGRGGEEALALAHAGVEFEIVCGISAGLAAPACAGIPVTHRGACAGVTFITGHSAEGDEPDWNALVRGGTTLVIFMGVARLSRITRHLLAAGMPAAMPAAAIERATARDQRVLRASVAALAAVARDAGLRSPAVLVIGKTVAIADTIAAARTLSGVEPGRCAA